MKGICLLVAVIACASALSTVDKTWEDFKTKYNKEYTRDEEGHRYQVFRENLKMIEEHNKRFAAGEVTFTMAMNHLGDLTAQEASFLRGAKVPSEESRIKGTKFEPRVGASYPDSVDWTLQGYVTQVKDQGQCGSCWAFSSTGSLEGQHFRYTGALISLSEQNLVDCVTNNYGCNGGWMDTAFDYIRNNGGIDTEGSYPYEAKDGACRYNPGNVGATVTGWVDIATGNEDALLAAVADNGPVSVTIDASFSSFQFYSSGVYYEPSCTTTNLDHAVLAAGYGVDNGTPFWLVKNSWGQGWGSGGYILMSRNANNNCGIAQVASFPTV